MLLLSLRDSGHRQRVVVKATLQVVAPAFPLFFVAVDHVLLHLEQQEGVANTDHQGLGACEGRVEDIAITQGLGGVLGGAVGVCRLRGAQE